MSEWLLLYEENTLDASDSWNEETLWIAKPTNKFFIESWIAPVTL